MFEPNHAGTRGWWPTAPKGDRTFRIATVGDSCTFGARIPYPENYTARLELLLQELRPDLQVEAMIAALPGYSTYQSRVLFMEHVVPSEPDLVVFYCGVWNDFSPAVRCNDEEWGVRLSGGTSRLWQVLERLFEPSRPSRLDLLDAMRGGVEPEDGYRVPLPAFRDNMRAMIGSARELGARAVVVLPPLADGVLENFPIAAAYRDAQRDIAHQEGALLVDAPALLESYEAGVAQKWRQGFGTKSVCFLDSVHPTSVGHRLIAQAIFDAVADTLPPAGESVQGAAELVSLEPEVVAALVEGELGLLFDRPVELGPSDRFFAGSWPLDVFSAGDRVRLEWRRGPVPGRHAIRWVSRHGATELGEVAVEPVRLQVFSRDDGSWEVRLEGPVRWKVSVWFSRELRAEPALTRYGEFGLGAEPDGRPAGRDDLPFRFDLLELPALAGTVGDDGTFVRSGGTSARRAGGRRVFVQGVVIDPENTSVGAVTQIVEL